MSKQQTRQKNIKKTAKYVKSMNIWKSAKQIKKIKNCISKVNNSYRPTSKSCVALKSKSAYVTLGTRLRKLFQTWQTFVTRCV